MNWRRTLNQAWADWHDARVAPAQRRPTVLQFPVNDICNSRCQMCNIWQQKRDHEITPDELDQVLSDPLFRAVRNVGINGGEPTLRRDLVALVEVLLRRLPDLSGVSLITNALRPAAVISAINEIGGRCRASGVLFDVMVSLDGIGEVHDRVRGVHGNFANADAVVSHILESPLVDARRIGCTVVADNVFHVEDVLEYAKRRGVYARFRLGVPHRRLYNATSRHAFELDWEARYHIAAFLDSVVQSYETDPGRCAFYRSLRDQIIYSRSRAAGCAWKSRGVTLDSRGNLSFCAVASPTLGCAIEQSASNLYWRNASALSAIVDQECPSCRHDYDGIADRRILFRHWARRLKSRSPEWLTRPLRHVWTVWRAAQEWSRLHAFLAEGPHPPRGASSILLCGWYGTETLGDRAILAGLCRLLLSVRSSIAIDVASLEPYVTEQTKRWMPELRVRNVLALADAESAIRSGTYCAIAVAGGPLMTPVPEVLCLERLFRVARKSGVRTAILGCGVGPLFGRGTRHKAIERLVRNAEICVLRDSASVRLAESEMHREQPPEAACDPAFFWEALVPTGIPERAPTPPRLALALREWQISEYALDLPLAEATSMRERLECELRVFVRTFAEKGAAIEPVCMHTLGVGGDDRIYQRRLLADHPETVDKISWRRNPPRIELERLRQADVICAMRYHAVVFALALRKPFVAIDYTRGGKIDALLRATGNEDRLVRPEDFSGDREANRLMEAFALKPVLPPVDLGLSETTYKRALARLLDVAS